MVCASSSERNRRVAKTLVNVSLLPELQTLPTSKLRFQRWPRHGSSCLFFAGTGEPAKRSFSRRTLLQAKAGPSVCSQSLAENETMCSTRCDAHPPRRFPRDRRPPRPIRRCAAAGRLSSALVRAVSTASRFFHCFALGVADWIRKLTAKIVEAENLAAEVPCLVRLAHPRNARQRGFEPTPQMLLAFLSARESPYRRRALIHSDAASHALALASCSRNRHREFFLFLCPQRQNKRTS